MASVGKVEALVAEGKIGDLIAGHRKRQGGPIVERRVRHLVSADSALIVGDDGVSNLAAPSFLHRHHELGVRERTAWNSRAPGRERTHLLLDELERALNFDPS